MFITIDQVLVSFFNNYLAYDSWREKNLKNLLF